MANQEHLALLKQGVEAWNEWRRANPGIKPDLTRAYLRGINLRGTNLSRTDLRGANLSQIDLSGTNLTGTDLSGANLSRANLRGKHLTWLKLSGINLNGTNLSRAVLTGAILIKTDLSETDLSEVNLSEINLRGANLSQTNLSRTDLSRANLSEINLSGANLSQTNLNGANLSGVDLSEQNLNRLDFRWANLSNADLSRTQTLGTNFKGATLTGACIENWNINSETNLENVICDYVYLKSGQQERRPSDPNKNFAPGEFTKLFQKVLETVDLIFKDGIDWQAFLTSFQKLQVECGSDELSIQAIEKKSGGAFVIRVEVPADANKAEVEKSLKREYEYQLKAIEEKYRLQLNVKDKQLAFYHQQSANLMEIIKLQASRPINNVIDVTARADNKNMNESAEKQTKNVEVEMNFQKEVIGAAGKVEGDMVVNPKQSLADSATEIQQLLQILDQSYPSDLPAETQAEIDVAVKGIDKNPTLKERVVAALQAGGVKALKELTDNPYVNILLAAYEGWRAPQ